MFDNLAGMFSGPQVERMISTMVKTATAEPGKAERTISDLLKIVAAAFPPGQANVLLSDCAIELDALAKRLGA